MKLSETSKIVLPLLLIAVFVFSTFGWIYRFQNRELAGIIETERLLDEIGEGMHEINRTIQSGILTLDERYAVQSARHSLRVFEGLDALEKLHPADAAKLRRMYLEHYVKIVSIDSLFLEKRLEEGRARLADLETSFARMNAEMDRMIELRIGQYKKAVRDINGSMAATSVIFTAVLLLIGGLFLSYSKKRKAAEKALIDAEKMASLGTLSAGVAHEIRNPLTIILHGVELLDTAPADGPGRREVINGIRQAVLRADGIIKGLLSYSQGPASAGAGISVFSVLEEALATLAQQRELRNIVIEKELPPDLPLARGDGGQLRQAFLNILVNAVEAMQDGGTLRIVRGKSDPHSLSISFVDTGAGIPEEELGKVSDPFYTMKQKSGNIGLGLSIARGIVEGHGGTLRIESAPGEGTRVTVALQLA